MVLRRGNHPPASKRDNEDVPHGFAWRNVAKALVFGLPCSIIRPSLTPDAPRTNGQLSGSLERDHFFEVIQRRDAVLPTQIQVSDVTGLLWADIESHPDSIFGFPNQCTTDTPEGRSQAAKGIVPRPSTQDMCWAL